MDTYRWVYSSNVLSNYQRHSQGRALFSGVCLLVFVFPWASSQAGPANLPGRSQFDVRFDAGGIVGLRPSLGGAQIDYLQPGRRLGDVLVRYRQEGGDWLTAFTGSLVDTGTFGTSEDGRGHKAIYRAPGLVIEVEFTILEQALLWEITISNPTDKPLEIGDLALPLPIWRGQAPGPVILKHSFISGHGSFIFWARSGRKGPYPVLVPSGNTHLEYWDTQGPTGSRGFNVYIHSKAAGAQASQRGTHWRQPHTSAILAPTGQPGDRRSYHLRLRWADDYGHIRQVLVEEGGIDVHVIPGMTVPIDLSARIAIRSDQQIRSLEAEFPDKTAIDGLAGDKGYRIYQVRFSRLGENRLTVRYGDDRHAFLEFFVTEPVETLIKKRAAFLARSQHRDPTKWYDGLITDWNMASEVLLSPDNYDRIPRSRIYAVTCDDPGLGKPAFLAAKNAEFPLQQEVDVIDYYIQHFVWGRLQRSTDESYPYGIYGIPDWKTNRDSNDPGRNGRLHIWRVYDYPHVVLMYLSMYRLAKDRPHIRTMLTAREYLLRAFGTAEAMFTIPRQIVGWSAYGTGFYNELVIVDLIKALQQEGMGRQADILRRHWEQKVRTFLSGNVDLFRSEYAFDSTGFESTHAIARYAVQRPDLFDPNRANAFMEDQIAANLFCRGCIEPAYYYLGSDYRGSAGNAYTLSYMSQMGGWAVLDYGLYFAKDPFPFLRLGYASYLSSWALMNTGTTESNYGYWYPGKANDGAAGGGFEPAPYGQTWLGQPHHRGAWYYACEIDLGYCGALRTAATILADDPIFGLICLGGQVRKGPSGFEVIPRDGLRRRFHAILATGRLHLSCDVGQFAADRPMWIGQDLSQVRFSLTCPCQFGHKARVRVRGLKAGNYRVSCGDGTIRTFTMGDGSEHTFDLAADPGSPNTYMIVRSGP